MTEAARQFLQSPRGQELLERYHDYNEAALFHLLLKSRKKVKTTSRLKSLAKSNRAKVDLEKEFLPELVSQIRLRRQAKNKFSRFKQMFFSSLALEQSTGETVARYLAGRFPANWQVADLTSGLGGNAIFLADRCQRVIAVDPNQSVLRLAQVNASVYGVSNKITFLNLRAEDALANLDIWPGIDAIFLDPARDRPGRTKTRSILNSRPQLLDIWEQLTKITPNIAVKISPAFDYKELALLPEVPEIELISRNNVNRVAMLWFGSLKTAQRRATLILKNKIVSFQDQPLASPRFVSGVQSYLYEPDKAVSKARLIDEIAVRYDLARFHHQVSLMTSSQLCQVALAKGSGLARTWKIEDQGEFSWSKLQTKLKTIALDRANVIVKNWPVLPEEVYRQTKLKEGGDYDLILTVFGNNRPYYLLGKRL